MEKSGIFRDLFIPRKIKEFLWNFIKRFRNFLENSFFDNFTLIL